MNTQRRPKLTNIQVPTDTLLAEAERRLRCLSPARLSAAVDFLAYLQEREENEATQELLRIPDFMADLREGLAQAERGEVVRWEDIREDV